MKISYKWLSEYVDLSGFTADQVGSKLTAAGIEVESLEDLGASFRNVVIGNILERKQHPNADRLTLCQVTTGSGVVHQIVCGATNHKQGDNVVVALPGAVLPGDFAIKLSKIRGVESQGMLCSETELGIADTSEGIMILPADAPVGKSFAEYRGLDDVSLELKVTPNRADCLSHFGLAREVACLLGREAKIEVESFSEVEARSADMMAVTLSEPTHCPRYAGRAIRGIKVGPSPAWLKQRMQAVGMKSINNVVDVTNFIMMELGQPMHAFDVKNIKGSKLEIGMSQAGEVFRTLDGTDLTLTGGELMIRDAERPVAMAGVIGGLNSGITDSTTDVFLESAYFRSSTVRKASRQFGIETESGYRFSRGVDADSVLLALNRCAQLIQKVAGGEILAGVLDQYPAPIQRPRILIDLNFVSQRLGYVVEATEFETWMRRLGATIEPVKGTEYQVIPPVFRHDLEADIDLVEEFARLAGYDRIPETPQTAAQVAAASASQGFQFPSTHSSAYVLTETLSRELRLEGFDEVNHFAFTSAAKQSKVLGGTEGLKNLSQCGLDAGEQPIAIKNPLNEEFDVMRLSLIPGLLNTVSFNSRHENHQGAIFEIGPVFELNPAAVGGKDQTLFGEEKRLGLALWGKSQNIWSAKANAPAVLELKRAIDQILASFQGRNWKWETPKNPPAFVHPNQCAVLFFEGQNIGVIGTLHPELAEDLGVRANCAVGEFALARLFAGQPRPVKTKAPPKFPRVERDLAFAMPKNMSAQTVIAEVSKAAGPLLQSCEVFDVFEGGNLAADQKSLALRLVFQDPKATLGEQQVQELHSKVISTVTSKLGIFIR